MNWTRSSLGIAIVKMLAAVISALLLSGCGGAPQTDSTGVTFCRDVAPIVFDKCVVCHRDQGAAPFALQTYAQASERAQQLADVTASRYMPPWLPAENSHPILGDRRLTADQIEVLARWAKAGAPEGDRAALPVAPTFTSKWILGEPDLVVRMLQPYLRPADSRDSWRNFVLPIEISESKFVRAYDVDPGNAPAVHHVAIVVDRSGEARKRDAASPEPGFGGMQDGVVSMGISSAGSDGPTLGWTPGKMPHDGGEETGWQIHPGDDLVLQLHMPAAGKDESVQSSVAFYFSDKPPKRQLSSILLSVREIDIPAGESRYQRELAFRLPIDVQLYGIFPHAHYLCEEMFAYAVAPNGERDELLHIPKWDFDWQDDYRYAQPITLTTGTQLSLEYFYNNSPTNIRNPNDPPARVGYGEQSTEAMGDLILYLDPVDPADRPKLRSAYLRFQYEKSLRRHRDRLAAEPNSPRANNAVAESLLLLGKTADAEPYLRRAIELGDDDARGFANLAKILRFQGRLSESLTYQESAVEKQPDSIRYRRDLALMYQMLNQSDGAKREYEYLLRADPSDVLSRTNLAMLLGQQKRFAESERHLKIAIGESPNYVPAHVNMAVTLRALGRYAESIHHWQRAIKLAPTNSQAKKQLAKTIKLSNGAKKK